MTHLKASKHICFTVSPGTTSWARSASDFQIAWRGTRTARCLAPLMPLSFSYRLADRSSLLRATPSVAFCHCNYRLAGLVLSSGAALVQQ
ncbi:hypothetical protein DEO72_LG10g998 [Vigna unguiculata]|uniref:Uncharacterized protein n=1 Tax=Vigna unguiculata TaxID=3917 RepID=A0A4D6NC92_VIGUN|nr:hypothetical protein DEO72_LG10g998 [Vigna unguiculata]